MRWGRGEDVMIGKKGKRRKGRRGFEEWEGRGEKKGREDKKGRVKYIII